MIPEIKYLNPCDHPRGARLLMNKVHPDHQNHDARNSDDEVTVLEWSLSQDNKYGTDAVKVRMESGPDRGEERWLSHNLLWYVIAVLPNKSAMMTALDGPGYECACDRGGAPSTLGKDEPSCEQSRDSYNLASLVDRARSWDALIEYLEVEPFSFEVRDELKANTFTQVIDLVEALYKRGSEPDAAKWNELMIEACDLACTTRHSSYKIEEDMKTVLRAIRYGKFLAAKMNVVRGIVRHVDEEATKASS